MAGSVYSTAQQNGPYVARVLDINTGSETAHTQSDDLFCIGLAHLADGTVLMAGGTLQYNGNPDNCNGRWHGLNAAYELSPSSETFTKVTGMVDGIQL